MKKKWLFLFGLMLLLAFAALHCTKKPDDGTEATLRTDETPEGSESAEAAPVYGENVILYYNLHGKEYDGMADDGLTSRDKNLDDGYFHIDFSSEGQIVEFLAKSRILTNAIDHNPVLAFTFSSEGVIEQAFPVEEIGGKLLALNYFVSSAGEGTLTVNTNNTNSGTELQFSLSEGVRIYDVSDPENNYGLATVLEEMDEIVAVGNEAGLISHVWVVSKGSQNKGRGGCICGANENGPHREGCDGTILYYWKPWTNSTALPAEGGYWYLDIEDRTITLYEETRLRSGMDIYLDLNGHTVYGPNDPTAGSVSIYFCQDGSVPVHVTILDSAGGGRFVLRNPLDEEGKSTHGLQSRFMVYTGPKHSLTIYGGTVDGSGLTGAGGNGSLIRCINGAQFNMHGGTLIGVGPTANTGGAVFCSGSMYMTGGTITGGHAKRGGNVFIGSYDENGTTVYGSFKMTGGEILNGSATLSGGNVSYYADGEFIIEGGTISGGTAPEAPEIYMYPKFDPAA